MASSPGLAFAQQKPSATPTPRVLLRVPFGVPAAKVDETVTMVAGAARDGGALSIRQSDFANAASGREEVKAILTSARENLKKAARSSAANQHSEAVTYSERAVTDYESIGADVWRTNELAFAYVRLGLARWKLAGDKPNAAAIAAFRKARSLDPKVEVAAPEFEPAEVATFKKFASSAPPPPAVPSEGFWSLARVMGLEGVIETRGGSKGVLALRVHRILPTSVKSGYAQSKAPGLDPGARRELIVALGLVEPPAAVAAVPTPVPTSQPDGTRVAVAPTPGATPAATGTPNGKKPAIEPNGGSGVAKAPAVEANATPTPLPVPVGRPSMIGNSSWAAVTGGFDRRASVYTTQTDFTSAASGNGGAATLEVWYVLGKVWAVSLAGSGMQRAYLVAEGASVQSKSAMEASLHVLRSDDDQGRWWVGGGVGYMTEPRFNRPSGPELVPALTRITPSVTGMAQFFPMTRVALRLRGTAGVAVESDTGADFGSGLGYDVGGEVSATYAFTRMLRVTGGAGLRRGYLEFQDKKTSVEARRAAWLGIEAGF